MTKQFNPGDEVFDIHGRAGTYVARVSNGHVVEPTYETDNDDGPVYGEAQTWREVFTKPPTEKLHAALAEVEAKLNAEKNALRDVRVEHQKLDTEHRARLERLKKYHHLSRLDDYIEGRVTHFVTHQRYSDEIGIETFEQVISSSERHSRLPLLVLYGNPYNDGEMLSTEWCLHVNDRYLKVLPCTSLEEAREKAQSEVDKACAAWQKDPQGNYGHSHLQSVVAAAQKHGLTVAEDVLSEVRRRNNADLDAQLARARTEVSKAQAALLALEALQPAKP